MSPHEVREVMWAKVLALYGAYWPGRVMITGPTILAMEEAGLSRHDENAVLAAVRIAGKTSRHPPSVAELLDLLEGETRRVPVYVTDLYGSIRLGSDGAPLVRDWTTERSVPAAYTALRGAVGLPPLTRPGLAYRPPADLDRPESDGEPRPVLPAALLARALGGPPGDDRLFGGPAAQPEPKSSHARANAVRINPDGCPACGFRGNQGGEDRCGRCQRALPGRGR